LKPKFITYEYAYWLEFAGHVFGMVDLGSMWGICVSGRTGEDYCETIFIHGAVFRLLVFHKN
jgi:hypothetical protein